MAQLGLAEVNMKMIDEQQTENWYFCPICKDLIYRPVSLSCGHTSCKACLAELLEKSQPPLKCPVCRNWIHPSDRDLYVNVALNIILNKVQIECTNEGCNWKGENSQRQDHYSSCPYFAVTCEDGCGFSGLRKTLTDHTRSCPNKKENCAFCQEGICRKDKEHHQVSCPEKPRQCPYECGALITWSHSHLHTKKCSNRVVSCKVNGCFATFQLKNEERHSVAYATTHQKLLSGEVQKLKHAILKKEPMVINRKEETITSFKWLVSSPDLNEAVNNKCRNEGFLGLISPAMSFKQYKLRCILRKSPTDQSAFYLSVRAEVGTHPLLLKTSVILKTERCMSRQEHCLTRLTENENCCEHLVTLQDINNGSLEITLYIFFYYLM